MRPIPSYDFLKKLEALPFVDALWLFGSRARGDNAPRADIDLAVLCPQATDHDWHRVLDIVNDADTLLKIDCVRFDHLDADDLLRQNIIRFKKILYDKDTVVKPLFWKDYFNALGQAVCRLEEVIHHCAINPHDYMQDASIQRFEFVIELFWKVLKKILSYEKIDATTPRDVLRQSFQYHLIDDEDMWLNMLDDRNNTSHVYKQEDAQRVFEHIKIYVPVLRKTYDSLKQKYQL